MTQQEEYCLDNQPTSGTADLRNTMVDRILHDKMQDLINQMGTLYQVLYDEESVNDNNCPRNISTLTSDNAVNMEGTK